MFGAFVVWWWSQNDDSRDGSCSSGRKCPICVAVLGARLEFRLREMGR